MVDLIGKRLGSWVVDKELGRGGMGRVYLAHEDQIVGSGETAAPRLAAIKVLSAELAQEAGFLERFQREIDVLEQLSHPNIVQLFESGFQEGRYYFVMEYLPGKNFEEIIHERGRLPWKEVLEIALQICPALKHAHDHGIIHRDIKLQNLLRADDGTVKLTDFGIAKVFAGKQLTVTGGLVGTAEFLSPEQAAGKQVTHRSDLYSFGVVLYTLLTGRTPFQGRSTLDLMHKHRFAQFDPPQRLVLDIPNELDTIICELLEKEPAKRPANGLVLLRQFETFRNKVLRREQRTIVTNREDGTQALEDGLAVPKHRLGPATLMSRLVRQELSEQNLGGPFRRFVNRPWVLVGLLLICLTIIVWRVWLHPPTNADTNVADDLTVPSEVERFYLEARRLYLDGEPEQAGPILQNLIDSFDGTKISNDQHWVRKARELLKRIKRLKPDDTSRWGAVYLALQRAENLKDTGKTAEADKVLHGLEELYRVKPARADVVKVRNEIERIRQKKPKAASADLR
jgi:serine/threonine-protein kinase